MAVSIKGQVAVVTGASRGIGRACALAFAREGAHVIVTARAKDELDTLVSEIEALGSRGLAVQADLSQAEDVERLRAATFDAFEQVDILVNNAGVAKYGPFIESTIDEYDWMMNTNMRSTYLCTRAFLPSMVERESGTVVIVSSQAGLHGFPDEAIYCATKHAQVGFAEGLDREYRTKNIKISLICPGGVNTYFAFGTGRTEGDPKVLAMLEADSVADAVVFAARQDPKSRILMIGMRPMSEST